MDYIDGILYTLLGVMLTIVITLTYIERKYKQYLYYGNDMFVIFFVNRNNQLTKEQLLMKFKNIQ